MKRITAFLLISGFFFSCQKEISHEGLDAPPSGGTTAYYLKAKVDGTLKTFSTLPTATINTLAGTTVLVIGGATADAETITLALNMNSGSPAVGTYNEGLLNPAYSLIGAYNNGTLTIYAAAGLLPLSVDPLKLTITSLTTTEIKGTFKGAFYKQDIAGGGLLTMENKRITEGEFNLQIR